MYEKGRSFVMAAGLVKAYEGHKFVYLHLLCQGFENIGKSLLLARNYEHYGPKLKSDFRHDLDALIRELLAIYGRDFLSPESTGEVAALSKFYKQHQLRYGDVNDFIVPTAELNAAHLHKELIQMLETWNQRITAHG